MGAKMGGWARTVSGPPDSLSSVCLILALCDMYGYCCTIPPLLELPVVPHNKYMLEPCTFHGPCTREGMWEGQCIMCLLFHPDDHMITGVQQFVMTTQMGGQNSRQCAGGRQAEQEDSGKMEAEWVGGHVRW